jgi:SAM-dependent methyltransferase
MKTRETARIPEIGTGLRPRCFLCLSAGRVLHANVKDHLFGAPGSWTFVECVNPACQLVWLDPMPLEAELWKAYQSYYTHQPANQTPGPIDSVAIHVYRAIANGYLRGQLGYRKGVGPPWYRSLGPLAYLIPGGPEELAARAMYFSAPGPDGRLLDIGCGEGQMLRRFERLGWDAEGVDTDPVAVATGRAGGLSISQGDVESQHYAANSFDAVSMNHVIEHVFDPVGVLSEISRILKVGGRLVIVTPNVRSWGHARFGEDWRGLEPPRHLHLFTIAALRDLVVRAGLRVVAARTVAKGVPYISSASRSLRRSRLAGKSARAGHFPEGLRGLGEQLCARTLLLHQRDAGEETVLIAEKDPDPAAING